MNESQNPDYKIARIAFASIVAIIMGALVPRALAKSFDHSLIIWLLYVILCGLILRVPPSGKTEEAFANAIIPGVLLPIVIAVYMLVTTFFLAASKGLPEREILIPWGPSLLVPDVFVLVSASAILFVVFIASLFAIGLSSLACERIEHAALRVLEAGPQKIDRARKILLSLTALIAALFALWATI